MKFEPQKPAPKGDDFVLGPGGELAFASEVSAIETIKNALFQRMMTPIYGLGKSGSYGAASYAAVQLARLEELERKAIKESAFMRHMVVIPPPSRVRDSFKRKPSW
jgi:hypothetical protein